MKSMNGPMIFEEFVLMCKSTLACREAHQKDVSESGKRAVKDVGLK
jgi:hypothetical protein